MIDEYIAVKGYTDTKNRDIKQDSEKMPLASEQGWARIPRKTILTGQANFNQAKIN